MYNQIKKKKINLLVHFPRHFLSTMSSNKVALKFQTSLIAHSNTTIILWSKSFALSAGASHSVTIRASIVSFIALPFRAHNGRNYSK